jgi:hypothetical protein
MKVVISLNIYNNCEQLDLDGYGCSKRGMSMLVPPPARTCVTDLLPVEGLHRNAVSLQLLFVFLVKNKQMKVGSTSRDH